jgi:hypothetical protein
MYRAIRYGNDKKVKDIGAVPNGLSASCHGPKLNNTVRSVTLEVVSGSGLDNLSHRPAEFAF